MDAADSNQVLAGAVFRLTNDKGYSKEFTTDVNGLVTFDNLKLGRYWLTEVKAPAGYTINPDYAKPVAVDIKSGDTIRMTIAD